MTQSTKDKTALVTGASRGAIAERLAKDGATVALATCDHRLGADGVSAVDRPLARHMLVECPTI